ncbi:hypothetical protein [Acinetobacter genomosp. 15BJ]|uniref:Lipoprotein n=1 Tax=Acinetobacter genomosp. 15BJ TaxID=106651 RepID=R9ANM2_9GAMM|nr:hypothetical protein [Acinetobacter genomosp. 15BJ]EOR03804.1 hypothetical protein F896_03340 [Acinetobacter genomosp. 15BJ]MCH7292851.1 hypothetical protein [Acinetobacter genomosp. 15BJ]MDO3658061.1 hypothetical protein [Acinetobacter genomosp. 15BJ]
MGHVSLKPSLVFIGVLIFTGCTDENGDFSVGVSLGGTGTGGVAVGTESPVPKPQSDVKPDRMEEDGLLYAVAYPNPITQYCNGIERTIQFVRHYSPHIPMVMGDRMDLFAMNDSAPIRLKLQVIVKNTTPSPIYEYTNSCKAAFQLTGTKTVKTTQTDYCLNDETVNVYQPNESRTYFYTFNLPNILQNWTASYQAQYSKKFYAEAQGSIYDIDSMKERIKCDPLNTVLLLDEYPSTRSGVPPTSNPGTENGSDSGQNDSTGSSEPPIFGGFDLGGEDTDPPQFGGFGLGDEL